MIKFDLQATRHYNISAFKHKNRCLKDIKYKNNKQTAARNESPWTNYKLKAHQHMSWFFQQGQPPIERLRGCSPTVAVSFELYAS